MIAIVRQEENLQIIQKFEDRLHRLHEQFYRFCMDTGKSYWLLHTAALDLGIRLKEDLLREFRLYRIEQTLNEIALMEMKVRRDERFRENPFYKG